MWRWAADCDPGWPRGYLLEGNTTFSSAGSTAPSHAVAAVRLLLVMPQPWRHRTETCRNAVGGAPLAPLDDPGRRRQLNRREKQGSEH